jgi:hypothetical protein
MTFKLSEFTGNFSPFAWEYYCRKHFLSALNLVQKRFNFHSGICKVRNLVLLLAIYVFLLELNHEIFI